MKRFFLIFIFLFPISISKGYAQDSISKNHYKNFNTTWTAEVPIWIPGLRGNLSYGRINSDGSENDEETEFNRVDNNSGLEFYFNGRLSKRFNRFWTSLDAFSGKVGSQFSYIPIARETEVEFVDITISGTSPRLTFGYSILNKEESNNVHFELIPYTGLRYISMNLKSDIFNNNEVIDLNPNWLEPIFGIFIPISYHRFKFEIQGDYGWSNRNNTLALHARARYRVSRLIDLALGITSMQFDYEDEIDNEALQFDLRLVGPTFAVSFNF